MSSRFNIKPNAEEYIGSMQNGSAEKIYAIDFFSYALNQNNGSTTVPRPIGAEYGLGMRVMEAIRSRIVENPNG